MDRFATLTRHVDLSRARVIEIGALAAPLVPPDTPGVGYVDHLSTEGLREHYRADPTVDTDALVPVTHVWSGTTFAEAIGREASHDAIVSAHVFEHLPNPVQWLLDCHTILKPGGLIVMILPDMRFTFDRDRNRTRTADWIGWYLDRHMRPSATQLFDYFAQATDVDVADAWKGSVDRKLKYDITEAWTMAENSAATGKYIDAHCSVFTPASLLSLFTELDRLDLFPFEVVEIEPTQPNELEFSIVLRRVDRLPPTLLTREVHQAIAREAGYTGEFGVGGFAAAMQTDPALKARVDGLKQRWIDTAREARGTETRIPTLDPALHDACPGPDDPRVSTAPLLPTGDQLPTMAMTVRQSYLGD
jgi:predicted SAM-dependent methyltransferase